MAKKTANILCITRFLRGSFGGLKSTVFKYFKSICTHFVKPPFQPDNLRSQHQDFMANLPDPGSPGPLSKRGSPKLIMLLKKFSAHGDLHLGYLQNPTYRCGLIKEIRLLEGLSVAWASLLPWRGPSLYFPMRVWLAAVRSPRPLTSCTPFIWSIYWCFLVGKNVSTSFLITLD